jgi:hypothetical protein
VANFQRCEISGNSTVGVRSFNSSIVRLSGSTVTGNGIGLENNWMMDPGTMELFGNNVIRGNTANIAGAITPVALQ